MRLTRTESFIYLNYFIFIRLFSLLSACTLSFADLSKETLIFLSYSLTVDCLTVVLVLLFFFY